MSVQIRVARAQYSGDPGFLSGLASIVGNVAGGFLSGGPLGALRGGLSTLAGGSSATVGGMKTGLVTGIPQGTALPGTGVQIQLPRIGKGGLEMGGIQVGSFPAQPLGPMTPGTAVAVGSNGKLCIAGHHLNKTTYFTRRGKVEAGTACVKNRHMNPLNPRAASRAMRRLDGFSRATRSIEKMMVKIARRNAPRSSRAAPRKACGKCR